MTSIYDTDSDALHEHYPYDGCPRPEVFSPGFRATVQLGVAAFMGYVLKHNPEADTATMISGIGSMSFFVLKGGINTFDGVSGSIGNLRAAHKYKQDHRYTY